MNWKNILLTALAELSLGALHLPSLLTWLGMTVLLLLFSGRAAVLRRCCCLGDICKVSFQLLPWIDRNLKLNVYLSLLRHTFVILLFLHVFCG